MKTFRPVVLLAGLATSSGVFAVSAVADVAHIDASKDTTIYQFHPEFGEEPISNSQGSYIFAGNNASGNARRALLSFDVAAAIPEGSTINSATLRLYMTRSLAEDLSVGIYRLRASWGEGQSQAFGNEGGGAMALVGDATWSNRFHLGAPWLSKGGDFVAGPSATQVVGFEDFYSFAAAGTVADVQSWLDVPGGNFGWIIIGDESTGGTAKRFASRSNPTAEIRPVLIVDFTAPASGCIGDYNADGGVDGSDVSAFFADWESGSSAADVNQDGGIDGSDVDVFFEHWEAGC